MPAKELSAEQKADARRLRTHYEAWKDRRRADGEPFSQEYVAGELEFKTQSAVSQYLNGGIPLNATAVKKFAKLLGVPWAAISPGIVAELRALMATIDEPAAEPSNVKKLAPKTGGDRGGFQMSAEQKRRAAAAAAKKPKPRKKKGD